MNKFHARKVRADDFIFDSQAEYEHYCELKLLMQSGEIKELEVHPEFILQPSFLHLDHKRRAIIYEADFAYFMDGQYIVEDVKGFKTREFMLKQKMFEFKNPTIELKIIRV